MQGKRAHNRLFPSNTNVARIKFLMNHFESKLCNYDFDLDQNA
jgi:hypothetical protein